MEDDALLRDALGAMVEDVDGFELLGTGGTLADGYDLLARAPDVLLVDLGLPDGTGLDLIAEASRPRPSAGSSCSRSSGTCGRS